MGRINSLSINGYIEVIYHKNEMITILDKNNTQEIVIHESVIPIIVKALRSNKKDENDK